MILGANKQQSQGKDGNFGTSHGEKILRPGNHLLAELCVRARVFSSRDAESGVLEISEYEIDVDGGYSLFMHLKCRHSKKKIKLNKKEDNK